MIDLQLVKAELSTVTKRAEQRYEAEVWGTGQFEHYPFSLLPDLPAQARREARRIGRMTPSMGPRIVSIKKFIALGDINWGGKDERFDKLFRRQDPDKIADELLEQAMYSGMIVGIVRKHPRGKDENGEERTGEPMIEPLHGHTEPLYDAEHPTRVGGIFQAWKPLDVREKGWRVRIFDFDRRTMDEWHKLSEPYMVGGRTARPTVTNAPMPRFYILRRGRGRMPVGDIELALPMLKSDWSSQVRGDRAEEQTAFSQLVVSGQVGDGTEKRSPAFVIRLEEGGDAKYLTPGDLSQIHNHHDRKIERLRRDLNLPGGVLSGSNISGEALREDNMHAIADAKHKARALAHVLTELAQDFASEHGFGELDGEVTVSINKEFEAATALDRVITLYEKDLLEHGAAVKAIAAYVPTWDDKEIDAFIKKHAELVEPPDANSLADDDGGATEDEE